MERSCPTCYECLLLFSVVFLVLPLIILASLSSTFSRLITHSSLLLFFVNSLQSSFPLSVLFWFSIPPNHLCSDRLCRETPDGFL
jgi:hypothetical protein